MYCMIQANFIDYFFRNNELFILKISLLFGKRVQNGFGCWLDSGPKGSSFYVSIILSPVRMVLFLFFHDSFFDILYFFPFNTELGFSILQNRVVD